MPSDNHGEFIYPRHCRVSVSPDKSQLALTFTNEERAAPLTVVLPLLAAAGFQRNLAQCLYLLGVRPVVNKDQPELQPAAEGETA